MSSTTNFVSTTGPRASVPRRAPRPQAGSPGGSGKESGREDVDELLDVSAFGQTEHIFDGASKTGFLEHPDRAKIVLGHVGGQRADRFGLKKQRDRGGGDAPTPELSTQPIAEEALVGFGVGPRANVSSDAVAEENGATGSGGVAEDVGGPMGQKSLAVPRRERGETGGFGIDW